MYLYYYITKSLIIKTFFKGIFLFQIIITNISEFIVREKEKTLN